MTGTKAPILKRFILSNTVELGKGPASIEVLAEADDGEGGSGIQYVSVWFDKQLYLPDYRTLLIQFGQFKGDTFGDATPTIGGDAVQLLDKTPAGTYTVHQVWVTDVAGNRTIYSTEQLQAIGMTSSLTVTGRPSDLTAPVLKSWNLPASVDLSRGAVTVPVVVEAADNAGGAGMSDVAIWFRQGFASQGQSTDFVYVGAEYLGDGFEDATPERAGTHKDGQQVVLAGVERMHFSDGAYAFDIDGSAGQAYRLYRAAFNREPDEAGVGYWIGKLDAGASLDAVAQSFIWSREFESLYGANPNDEAFLSAVYRNVLHRAPDADGYAYWMKALKGAFDRADLLVLFSESTENVAQVVGSIEHGFAYYP